MVRQCPIKIECEVADVLNYGDNEEIVGRVVKSYVDSRHCDGDKLDFRTINLVFWTTGRDFHYYSLGERTESNQEDV
jgi:flavin reductase (DIM6/NTAB) family NADH-FMN oxidoreductase RutF